MQVSPYTITKFIYMELIIIFIGDKRILVVKDNNGALYRETTF